MTTIAQVRAAAAAALAPVTAATSPPVQVFDAWPGQLNAPCLIVSRTRGPVVTEFDGAVTTWLHVDVFLPWVDVPGAQDLLDGLLSDSGSTSIRAALATDSTWGGVVRSAVFDEPVEEQGLTDVGAVTYLKATVPVTVVHPA